MIQVDAVSLSIVTAFFIPPILAFAAKLKASVFVKAAVNVGAAVIVAVVTVLTQNPEGIPYREFAIALGVSLFTSETMYAAVWKPTGIFAWIQNRFPGGIGSEVILDGEPGLNPDAALHEIRDIVKPIFTEAEWQAIHEMLEQHRTGQVPASDPSISDGEPG